MRMKHPKTGGVAECSEEAFLFWKQKGWERAADDEELTNAARVASSTFKPVPPEELAAAQQKDAAARVGETAEIEFEVPQTAGAARAARDEKPKGSDPTS